LTCSRRGALNWLFGAVVSGLLVGCLAPTLPLPPPSRPEVTTPNAAGMIHIRGTVRPKAEVFAKNRRTLKIVGEETDESGKYDLTMQAEVDDQLIVWYTDHGDESDLTEITVPDENDFGGAGANSR